MLIFLDLPASLASWLLPSLWNTVTSWLLEHPALLFFLLFCWFLLIFLTSEHWHAQDSVLRPCLFSSTLTPLVISSSVIASKIKLPMTPKSGTCFFPRPQTYMTNCLLDGASCINISRTRCLFFCPKPDSSKVLPFSVSGNSVLPIVAQGKNFNSSLSVT